MLLQISTCFWNQERTQGNISRVMNQIANAKLLMEVLVNVASPAEHVPSDDILSLAGAQEASSFPSLPSSSDRRNRKSRNTSATTTKSPQLHGCYNGRSGQIFRL